MGHLFTRKMTPARRRFVQDVLRERARKPPEVKIWGFKPLRKLPEIIELGVNRNQSIAYRRSPRFPKVRGAE